MYTEHHKLIRSLLPYIRRELQYNINNWQTHVIYRVITKASKIAGENEIKSPRNNFRSRNNKSHTNENI